MNFHDIFSTDLPAPRDDEPESLRDDILDELADHLACAHRREVMRGADAQTARQRVLERFGDPAAVARRLWFDAMKGRIMKQRILMIYSIVLTLLFVGLVGLLFMQSVAAQRLARQALARAEEERHRAEEAQREMLQKLEAISKAAESPMSPDWIPVTFKLTQETPDGPPAVGFQASLGKGGKNADEERVIHRQSDDKGIVDFGVVQPGDWEYTLGRGTDDLDSWYANGKLTVLPSAAIEKTIVCPDTKARRVPITAEIEWPRDLVDKGFVVLAVFRHTGFVYQPPVHWQMHLNGRPPIGHVTLVGGTTRKAMAEVQHDQYFLWDLDRKTAPSVEFAMIKQGQIYVDVPGLDLAGSPQESHVLPGTYQVVAHIAFRPLSRSFPNFQGIRGEFIAFSAPHGLLHEVWTVPKLPISELNRPKDAIGSRELDPPLGRDSYFREAQIVEARKAQPNHWTIHLPDELVETMREKLKDQKKQ